MSHGEHTTADELARYLVGALDIARVRELESHLLACAPCRALLEQAVRRDQELSVAAQAWRERLAVVVPLWRRPQVWGGLALAAGMLIGVYARTPPAPDGLPAYTVSVSAGDQPMRGDTVREAVPSFAPGSRVQLVLKPDRAGAEPEIRVFVVREPNPVEVRAEVERRPGGVARVSVVVGEEAALGSPGPAELLVALGPPGAVWKDVDLADAESRGWKVIHQPIVVTDLP